MEVHVPHDVLSNHILPRIPAKSVCRFRCVSKEWYSFLMSDMFKKKHNDCHINDHENNLKLLFLSKTETSIKFTTIDCEAPPSDKGLTPRPLPQFGDTTPLGICILASFHGLVCLGILETCLNVYSDIILWNPLTNEYKRVSKSTPLMNEYTWYSRSVFGLYYSQCEDDYKLLFVGSYDNKIYIYSLKSDSWRKVDVFQHASRLHLGSPSRGTYLNENLYFLNVNSSRRLKYSIIRFDTKTERLSNIESPNVDVIPDAYSRYNYATIMVKSECIHVCVKYDINISCGKDFKRTTCIKLWKLDEYENMTEVLTCQLRTYGYDHTTISSLRPFHLMKNGNWLMMMNNCFFPYNDGIYKVDIKKKTHITNNGKEKEEGSIYEDFEYAKVRMGDNTNINNLVDKEVGYIETFVSPNR